MNGQRCSYQARCREDRVGRSSLCATAAGVHPSVVQLDMQAALAHADDTATVFKIVAQGARRLGFEQCAYGMRMPVPFTNRATLVMSDYDARWQQRYREQGYLRIDPTVVHGVRSNVPLIWSNELFRHTPQLWSEARAFDLRVGWAQSCFDAAGAVGMLSLARSHEALSRAEVGAREPDLRWLASVAHQWLSEALRREHRAKRPELTVREVEVLRWMADGKTSEEAAIVLRISVHTVNFHVKNAIAKLGVANKTAAVSNAVGLGLLD